MTNTAIDIFSANLCLPRRVYIIGSGPGNTAAACARIPDGAYTICCNKGVVDIFNQHDGKDCCLHLNPDLWIVSDLMLTGEPWFDMILPEVPRLFGNQLIERGWPAQLSFEEEPWVQAGDVRPLYGKLRGGMTILGIALQLVYWMQRKERPACKTCGGTGWLYSAVDASGRIDCPVCNNPNYRPQAILVGFDMAGQSRFDETPVYKEGHWDNHRERLDAFISTYLPGQVYTLSPTALTSVHKLGDG